MPKFQINADVTLHYEITGQGPPLLLIHGFMGTGTTEFPDLLPHLAKDYRVIAPDLRGYGQSTPKPRLYGKDFYRQDAEDLAALLAHLEMTAVAVMGYSDGGEVALWLPLLAASRIRAVVTWGATGHFSPAIKPAVLSYLGMAWRSAALDTLHGAEHITEMTQRWVHSMSAIIDGGGDITYSQAADITCPVLLMLGDKDDLNPVAQGQAMANVIPKGKLSVYKNTGHAVHRERPRQFRKEVRKFLK